MINLREQLKPGDQVRTWCSKCGRATLHVWQPGTARPLRCTEHAAEAIKTVERRMK